MRQHIRAAMADAAVFVTALSRNEQVIAAVGRAAELAAAALESGGRVLACGNGGSMSDAMHFAEELSGRFRLDRAPLAALAISDPAHLTCTANDFGYDHVFSRFVEAVGRPADVLVAISTSGESGNVLRAAEAAKGRGMEIVALTGREGSPLHDWATVVVCTPAGAFSDRIQEQHAVVLHTLVETIERRLFPDLYPQ